MPQPPQTRGLRRLGLERPARALHGMDLVRCAGGGRCRVERQPRQAATEVQPVPAWLRQRRRLKRVPGIR